MRLLARAAFVGSQSKKAKLPMRVVFVGIQSNVCMNQFTPDPEPLRNGMSSNQGKQRSALDTYLYVKGLLKKHDTLSLSLSLSLCDVRGKLTKGVETALLTSYNQIANGRATTETTG